MLLPLLDFLVFFFSYDRLWYTWSAKWWRRFGMSGSTWTRISLLASERSRSSTRWCWCKCNQTGEINPIRKWDSLTKKKLPFVSWITAFLSGRWMGMDNNRSCISCSCSYNWFSTVVWLAAVVCDAPFRPRGGNGNRYWKFIALLYLGVWLLTECYMYMRRRVGWFGKTEKIFPEK